VRLAPPTVKVTTFHMLGDQYLRAEGYPPDFRQPGVFEQLADAFIRMPPSPEDLLDVLVIDEGQDFVQAWADALLTHLRPNGRAWWLEDPMQNLYDKPRIDLPGWVMLRAEINYRTPRDVLRDINLFIEVGERIEAGGPLEGDGIDIASYIDFTGLRTETVAAIGRARKAGFKSGDIAVLTYCGRERSVLMRFDRLGDYTLRRFGGTYDDAGNPVYQDGDILVETVFRFKGQSAPCIILTEIDFEALDERAARRLYVGATRASMQLSLVMSERAAGQLLARIG
jgi:superfamily I DNA and RNA helicase